MLPRRCNPGRKLSVKLPDEYYQPWGGLFMQKTRYKVHYREAWVTPAEAAVVGISLHYRLYDGTEGVAKPGEWKEYLLTNGRVIPVPVKSSVPDDNILDVPSPFGNDKLLTTPIEDDNILE